MHTTRAVGAGVSRTSLASRTPQNTPSFQPHPTRAALSSPCKENLQHTHTRTRHLQSFGAEGVACVGAAWVPSTPLSCTL
jgi:hypothetical protein